jgi:uncharacterized protein (TIGR00725 family)
VSRAVQIAVIGAAEGGAEALEAAEEVGRLLAEAGAVVICGGRGGVMEAASRGASGAGGVAIGVLPGSDPEEANEHVAHVVATGVGQARNLAVVGSGSAVIAVDGHWGTLSEIAFARKLCKPVVALRSWSLAHRTERELGIVEAETPAEAVEAALAAAGAGG